MHPPQCFVLPTPPPRVQRAPLPPPPAHAESQLSAADRAVMAMARAATSLPSITQAERAAHAHGLCVVTSSQLCAGPLLPPAGCTIDEDAADGDGMALNPAQHAHDAALGMSGSYSHSYSYSHGSSSSHGSGGHGSSRLDAAGSSIATAAAAAMHRVARAASGAAAEAGVAPAGRAVAAAVAARVAAAAAAAAASTSKAANPRPHGGDPGGASAWLVADDARGGVRYIIVAAGPALAAAPAAGLTRDLVAFESYALGVKVNRRLYAEAASLYARFIPLVLDYLAAVPHGHVCFGGQGLGGSLAVMLQLMCVSRGLRYGRLLPAVAVGAPPVLGHVPLAGGRGRRAAHAQVALGDVLEELLSRSVLEELGLPREAVRNIVEPPPPPVQQQQQQQHAASAAAAAAAAAGGRAGVAAPVVVVVGAQVRPAAGAAAAAAQAAAPAAQVFRLVGEVVQVAAVPPPMPMPAAAVTAAAVASAHAPAAAPAHAHGLGGVWEQQPSGESEGAVVARRLEQVALVGSIATAAATAAAAAAAAKLRHIGAGALRVAALGTAAVARGGFSGSAQQQWSAVAAALPHGRAAWMGGNGGGGEEEEEMEEEGDEDGVSAWGV